MRIIATLLLFSLLSCSNYSKHMVSKGDFVIRNGTYNNTSWSEDLDMKRISWFSELTLLFDTIYIYLDDDSKFMSWFSKDELSRVSHCRQKLVTMNYALDDQRISHQMYRNAIREYSFEEVSSPNFVQALKSHPDFSEFSLSLYKVNVYCSVQTVSDKIGITFPNYKEVTL